MLSQLLAVSIQAADRPTQLLRETLTSFRQAGFEMHLDIFCEPNVIGQPIENTFYHRNPLKLGVFANWRQAAIHLLDHTTTPWLMIMQDDILWRMDAASLMLQALQHFRPERIGFLSPYTSRAMVPGYAQRTENIQHWVEAQFSNNAFVGAQALCFSRTTLQRIVSHDDFLQHTSHRKVDVLIGNIVRKQLQLPIRVHVPSLVEHQGWNSSTIGRDKIPGLHWQRQGFKFSRVSVS